MHFKQGTFSVEDEQSAIQGCWERGGFVRLDKPGTISVVGTVGAFDQCREFLTGKPAPPALDNTQPDDTVADEIPDEGNG